MSAVSSSAEALSPLQNPRTGQVFSWNGGGWQESGHVATPGGGDSGVSYGSTNWTGNAARSTRSYTGRSLAGLAAWHAGHVVGRTMSFIGMGKEQ
jgi:hypothetical protein